MNLAQLYSLSSGQKLDKIYTLEKFYPGLPKKYIVIQPWSKPSKNYKYWDEVLQLLMPELEKNNIKVVQVGGKNEQALNGCIHTQGLTNWGQLQYIISKSLLVLCTDSVSAHLAGHYNVPLVDLISNNFKECVSPYFGDKNKQIILEPNRNEKNPLFSLDEGQTKQIDEIKPEDIVFSVYKLLDLSFNYPFKTLNIGNTYNIRIIESSCDSVVDVKKLGVQQLIIRLDINFNLLILQQQLQVCPCQIVTDQQIPVQVLQNYKPHILDVIYKINENHNPQFVKDLTENRIKYQLISDLSIDKLNPIKLDYLDYNLIFNIDKSVPKELKDKSLDNIYYKTSKLLLGKGKFYSSVYDYNIGRELHNPMKQEPQNILNKIILDELWNEKDFCMFMEKT